MDGFGFLGRGGGRVADAVNLSVSLQILAVSIRLLHTQLDRRVSACVSIAFLGGLQG